jgi:hypothetical protein
LLSPEVAAPAHAKLLTNLLVDALGCKRYFDETSALRGEARELAQNRTERCIGQLAEAQQKTGCAWYCASGCRAL